MSRFNPQLRLPVWPLASSLAARYGMDTAHGVPACSTRVCLRSADGDYLAMSLALRFQAHSDARYSLQAVLSDVYSADVYDWERLGRYLKWADRHVQKVLGATIYPHQRDLPAVLAAILSSLGIREVVEYRGIGVADVIRPLDQSDLANMVTILGRLCPFDSRRAA